ncbi:SRPBCC family protein [Microbacterium sp. ET2]|uniref:SRPBCC family protein n=1 Tax=Microbacterium albipurpureum TaxID=3050384 RepID=UPI00259CF880|nr:SRPBCC family protein [Microbacterium sp. ET2 (Ac-2212)]WJL96813.1 SRPBCC family protein [Microbacterium sp. ET2 (Ac-2212)]
MSDIPKPSVTGVVESIDSEPHLVLRRTFASSAKKVWRDLTDSDRLSRWIGHWKGDPAEGHVSFQMTAEGDNVPPETFTIRECDKPRRFVADTQQGGGTWHLWFELREDDGETTLTFGQRLNPNEDVGSIGPGWEYYLDRLVVARQGGDVDAVEWDAYYPALRAGYQKQVAAG